MMMTMTMKMMRTRHNNQPDDMMTDDDDAKIQSESMFDELLNYVKMDTE